ncbi:hypothetical protein B0A55_05516 [Friedmanniomyces simplex]|uniref:glutaminase n=1 Tax=Friedmanniomyces simplex TaxID=329884 RepID=A0A4U0XFR3_9PEZI|nr:hypothetical protein B0A55_05516 [Friedmanniomyces simplex]
MINLTVGVLALQGAFVEHLTLLRQAAEELQRRQPLQPNTATATSTSTSTTTTTLGPRQRGSASPSSPASPHTDAKSTADAGTDAAADILPHKPPPRPTPPDLNHSSLSPSPPTISLTTLEVRTPTDLARCDALILPGGESTSISLIAARTGLLEPLRDFVKVLRKPVWGTCAGLILLAESADRSKSTGQELIGGLDVRVQRNYFGRQVESFEAELELSFLGDSGGGPFHSVFIRAPVVAKVLSSPTTTTTTDGGVPPVSHGEGDTVLAPQRQATKAQVEILGRLPGRAKTIKDQTTTAHDLGEDGDIVAVRQGNVFGTAFHPELTGDGRIHAWWLREVLKAKMQTEEE